MEIVSSGVGEKWLPESEFLSCHFSLRIFFRVFFIQYTLAFTTINSFVCFFSSTEWTPGRGRKRGETQQGEGLFH